MSTLMIITHECAPSDDGKLQLSAGVWEDRDTTIWSASDIQMLLSRYIMMSQDIHMTRRLYSV